jgi:adenylylsulfate kinase
MSQNIIRHSHPVTQQTRAERSEMPKFTGIDAPSESPENPEVHIRTDQVSVAGAVNQLLPYLDISGVLKADYQPVAAGY